MHDANMLTSIYIIIMNEVFYPNYIYIYGK